MSAQLTKSEEELVQKYLENFGQAKDESSFKYFLISVLLSILGLFIIIYTWLLTLNNMVDRVIHWVFLPGLIGGVIIIMAGFFIWQYYRQLSEKRELASILKKLRIQS